MNTLDQLLQDDLNRLVDRLSAVVPEREVAGGTDRRAEWQPRLDTAEAQLTAMRQDLLRRYAAWRAALEELGDLMALAELAAEPLTPVDLRAA